MIVPHPEYLQESMTVMQNTSGSCPTGIPIEAVPVIQQAVVSAVITWELAFMVIGMVIAFAFSYVCFRFWKAANRIDELIEDAAEAE